MAGNKRNREEGMNAAAAAHSLPPPSPPPSPPPPDGSAIIGRRVSVLWPVEDYYFPGVIGSYSPVSRTHVVQYDDGEDWSYVLSRQVLRWEGETPVLPGPPQGPAHVPSCVAIREMAPPAGCDDAIASGPMSAEQMQRELAALRKEMQMQRAEFNARVTSLVEELRSQATADARAHRLQEESNNCRWAAGHGQSAGQLPEPTLAWADSPMAVLPMGVLAKIMDSLGPCAKQRITAGLVCRVFKEACSGPATVYRFGEYEELGGARIFSVSPAGRVFAYVCGPEEDDGDIDDIARSVRILALDSGREIQRMESPRSINYLAFNHDGIKILVVWRPHIHIRQIRDGSVLATIDGDFFDATFSGASSEFMVAAQINGDSISLGRWSSSTGELFQRIRIDLPARDGLYDRFCYIKPTGRGFVAYEINIPNVPALVYTVSVDTAVEAWRLPASDDRSFYTFSWSPDGSRLLSCSSLRYNADNRQDLLRFQLWDAADGREIWRSDITWRHQSGNYVCWSPDGRQICVSCADTEDADNDDPAGGVIVADALTGELRRLNCGPQLMWEVDNFGLTADSRALLLSTSSEVDNFRILDLRAETTVVNRL